MKCRVSIQWTDAAKAGLAKLPKKVRAGIIAKIDDLSKGDPRQGQKPLTGTLAGYYRVVYSRYRAIYTCTEKKLASGAVRLHIQVLVVAVGIRKEHDKNDVYNVAKKLVDLGLFPSQENPEQDEEE